MASFTSDTISSFRSWKLSHMFAMPLLSLSNDAVNTVTSAGSHGSMLDGGLKANACCNNVITHWRA